MNNKLYWINLWSLWCSLCPKECRLLLRRPAFFVLWALFSALAGLICFALLYQLIHSDAFASPELTALGLHQIITSELVFPLMGTLNVLLMVLVPGLLAKIFTQEYQLRTDWLWFQGTVAPPWMVLCAKWFAGLLAAELFLTVVLLFPCFFWMAGIQETVLLLTGLLGLMFQTLLYSTITLFYSFLLRSSTLVLFAAYATIMSTWMLTYLAQWSDTMAWQSYWLSLAPSYHFEQLAKGHLTTATVFYYGLVVLLLGLWMRAGWWRRHQRQVGPLGGRGLALKSFFLLSLSCFLLGHYLTSHWTVGIELAAEKGWGMSAGLRQLLKDRQHHFKTAPLSLLYIGPKQQWQEMNEVHRRLEAMLGPFSAQYMDPDYSPGALAQLQVKQVPAIRLTHEEKEVWITSFDQQSWFDAFAQLTGVNRARYCWISDLGAPSLDDTTSLGLSSFKQTLRQRGIVLSLRSISELTQPGALSSSACLGLVFWGVTQDLTPVQAKILRQWSGQWVVALDPFLGHQAVQELRGLMRELFGVEWSDGLAIDQRAEQLKLDPFFILGATNTTALQTLWPLSGHLQVKGKASYVELMKTTSSSQVWLERSQAEVNQTQPLSFNPSTDLAGPLLLALQVENRALLLANTKAATNGFQRYPEAGQLLASFWQQLALKTSVTLTPVNEPIEPPLVSRPWLTELKAYVLLALSVGFMPLCLLLFAAKLLLRKRSLKVFTLKKMAHDSKPGVSP